MISIFADGSSSGAGGGPGGYGWVIVREPDEEPIAWGYGGSPWTTNNLMEMEGAIQGLQAFLELGFLDQIGSELVELVSDSQYCLGMAGGTYNPSTNIKEATRLRELAKQVLRVERGDRLRWVRGHIGNRWNEVCDQLAKQGKLEHTDPAELAKKAAKKNKKRTKPTVAE